mmetsp:Transcript_35750/g.84377  ORF Transcript_35750/g.84377 Transcript_35750/m.84377 type:complete len:223 (+) Transcript_35750:1073-1741(+)
MRSTHFMPVSSRPLTVSTSSASSPLTSKPVSSSLSLSFFMSSSSFSSSESFSSRMMKAVGVFTSVASKTALSSTSRVRRSSLWCSSPIVISLSTFVAAASALSAAAAAFSLTRSSTAAAFSCSSSIWTRCCFSSGVSSLPTWKKRCLSTLLISTPASNGLRRSSGSDTSSILISPAAALKSVVQGLFASSILRFRMPAFQPARALRSRGETLSFWLLKSGLP